MLEGVVPFPPEFAQALSRTRILARQIAGRGIQGGFRALCGPRRADRSGSLFHLCGHRSAHDNLALNLLQLA